MATVGEWWSKMFGRAKVEWRAFDIEHQCTSSDDGVRCTEPGRYVVAFRARGALCISTTCKRHYEKWKSEADAHDCEMQHPAVLERLPFPLVHP